MKNLIIVVLLAFVTSGVAFAQRSEVRKVGSFKGVSAASGIDVFLKKGATESVRVEVDDDDQLDRVVTEVSGTYLKILITGRYRGNIDAKVYVTYVSLDKIVASSAANIYSDEVIKADRFEVSASSAASIEVSLDVASLEGNVSSAADVELTGKAKFAEFDVSSAAKLNAYDLEVDSFIIEASSAGSAKVSVVNELQAEASSGADIKFKGNPAKSRTNSSSGGSVKKTY